MSSEPKKPIEEILEAAAKARREAFGTDPKMPNPMRARLHEEIARRERDQTGGSRFSWLQMFWPRLAVAAVTATILIMGPVMWWRASHPEAGGGIQLAGARSDSTSARIASNETAMQSEEPKAVAGADQILSNGPAAAAPAQPPINLADSSRAKIEPAPTPALQTSSSDESDHWTAAPAKELPKERVAAERSAIESRRSMLAGALGRASATASRSGGVEKLAQGEKTEAAKSTIQFLQRGVAQSFRNNSSVSPAANILNNFQVEQEGSAIRVVDSDGSTYTGKIEAVDQLAKRTSQSYKSAPEAKDTNATAQSRFRATGYNLSLKKSLVFEGDFLAPSAEPQSQQLGLDREQQTDTTQLHSEVARIIGTAKARGESPVEIDAIAVPRSSPTQTATKAAREKQ